MTKFLEYFTGDKTEREDLIAFFHHTLRESKTCQQYLKDAEKAGDKVLLEFFKEVCAQDRLRAYRAEELLRRVH